METFERKERMNADLKWLYDKPNIKNITYAGRWLEWTGCMRGKLTKN